MFANSKSDMPVLKARVLCCSNCGHETRLGLRVYHGTDRPPLNERRRCPRCAAQADIVSRDCDWNATTPRRSRGLNLLSKPLTLPKGRFSRLLREIRSGLITGAAIFSLAFLIAPAVADALTDAVEQEVHARTFYLAYHDTASFCDARIQAYRSSAAEDGVWDALSDACPQRRAMIEDLRATAG